MKRKLSIMNVRFFNATVVAFKHDYLLHFLTFPSRTTDAILAEVTAIINVGLRRRSYGPSGQLRKLGMPIIVAATLPMIFIRLVITRLNTSLGEEQRH